MALNIKNTQTEDLAASVAALAHETKTEAIRKALLERQSRLQARAGKPVGKKNLSEFLERNIWPLIPAAAMGRPVTREEEDQILGYGPEGF